MIGDDGLGPAFIKHLEARGGAPAHVGLLDAGTGVRTVLFGMVLAEKRPKRIVIVDAVDMGRAPGEVFEIDLAEVPPLKADDFSMHQLPTSNLLRELRDQCGVEVRVVAVQVAWLPDELRGGLSDSVAASLERARELVERLY
ncbi:MAG: hydrogenase maturation protease [Elusimicrobia bacterium]|nr:hydrogenase maturation protease [Elusimicrobiota bacterium]